MIPPRNFPPRRPRIRENVNEAIRVRDTRFRHNHADLLGLYNVVRRMDAFGNLPGADRAFWTPAPLLARLAAEGKAFNS